MAKNKTTETKISVFDFINSYVDNDQKKVDSFQLIELMSEWSGFEPKMWDRPLLDLAVITIDMLADMKVMLL